MFRAAFSETIRVDTAEYVNAMHPCRAWGLADRWRHSQLRDEGPHSLWGRAGSGVGHGEGQLLERPGRALGRSQICGLDSPWQVCLNLMPGSSCR